MAQTVKNLPANTGDQGLISGSGRSPGEGQGNPLSILAWRIPMDRRAWQATVHRGAESQTQLSDYAQHIVLINYRSSY